jgi:hypothetical protein
MSMSFQSGFSDGVPGRVDLKPTAAGGLIATGGDASGRVAGVAGAYPCRRRRPGRKVRTRRVPR